MNEYRMVKRLNIRGAGAALLLSVLMALLPAMTAAAGPSQEVSGGTQAGGPAGSNSPVSASAPAGELRGVWISYLDWNRWPKDYSGFCQAVDSTMDICASKGLNAVFVHIRPDGDAMYPSAYYPWSKFASGKQGSSPGYDPLAYVVQSAHARGLQIHGWINPFRITGYLNKYSDLSPSNPAILWAQDGDPSNDRWVLLHKGEYYYNPSVPQVRQRIIEGVREVVANYDVDGIHFDDYFYPDIADDNEALWFDRPEYLASHSSESIVKWRRDNINQLISGVYSAIKETKPQVVFGVSPEGNLRHLRLETRLFVDIDTWMSQPGYVDYIMPQIYWGFEAKSGGQAAPYAYSSCLAEWILLKQTGNVTLYVGLPLYKTGTDAADGNEVPEWLRFDDIMKRQVLEGRSSGQVKGYCFYDFSSLTRETAAAEVANVTALFR